MSAPVLHLSDQQLQGLADGTLRGPEGLSAREHCDACLDCGAELQLYGALAGQLSSLQDPQPPPDFTATVMASVHARETQLVQKRHTLLAALPAAALAIVAIVGWAVTTAPATHVDRVVEGMTLFRTVMGVVGPVLEATRLPLGLAAFAFLALILGALSRTLRTDGARPAAS